MSTPTPQHPRRPLRGVAAGLAKLAGCGAILCAIAFGLVALSPDGVKPTQADIADFETGELSNTQRFVLALDKLGHEKPRIYDYNGNTIYFSTRVAERQPRDLIEEYQRTFVEQGVNSRDWDPRVDLEELEAQGQLDRRASQQRLAMLNGELQVLYHDDQRVIMGAALIDPKKKEFAFDPTHEQPPDLDFTDMFVAHRYIEAEWNPVLNKTEITATWGDESFDIKKTFPAQLQDPEDRWMNNSTDTTVPACIGCERLTRFAAVEGDRPYVKQIFASPQDPAQLESFYQQALGARGWQPSKAQARLESMGARPAGEERVLQFRRDAEFLTVTIHPEEAGGATVSTFLTD